MTKGEHHLAFTDEYEILTPDGWSDFKGVRKSFGKKIFRVSLQAGVSVDVTANHRFLTQNGYKNITEIGENTEVLSTYGPLKILGIETLDRKEPVYDALEVAKGHQYYTNGVVSHNCEFLGSSGTLIDGTTLKNLTYEIPIHDRNGFKVYENPVQGNFYSIICDVSRGKGLDYSAFCVIDVTKMPYRVVATFRDNTITPWDYAEVIYRTAKMYNEAYVLVEVNDIGEAVSETLWRDLEYENILCTENAGRSGKRITFGHGTKLDRGIKTTKTVKSVGCSMLKMLVEQEQLSFGDEDIIFELNTFSKSGASYEAEPGCHDDMVMTLVLFAWLTQQTFFKEMSDINTLENLKQRTREQLDEDVLPLGFNDDGMDDFEEWGEFGNGEMVGEFTW